MLLRTLRRAVARQPQQHAGRGAVLASIAAAAGAMAGATAVHAHAESASGRWEWPSWLPSEVPIPADGSLPIRSTEAEKAHAPPLLSPGPQTSQPVFKDKNLESMRLARIRQYEEDIRKLSTPEKVFAYFASSADKDGVPRMTSHDLLRAMVRADDCRKNVYPMFLLGRYHSSRGVRIAIAYCLPRRLSTPGAGG